MEFERGTPRDVLGAGNILAIERRPASYQGPYGNGYGRVPLIGERGERLVTIAMFLATIIILARR